MLYRPWQIARPDPARRDALAAALGLPPLVCGVLCARGIDTPEAARALCGEGAAFPDPMGLPGMAAAVERIRRAVDGGERIAVFGDYDVDGVTATALLYLYLDSVSADVYYKLPSREDEGYGLSAAGSFSARPHSSSSAARPGRSVSRSSESPARTMRRLTPVSGMMSAMVPMAARSP